MVKPTFFATPQQFRAWLQKNAARKEDLLVGFYKTHTGLPSITWPQSVDQALCFGWIDGVRKRLDDDSYTIRFTPRRPSSHWSAVNVARVKALTQGGQMTPAGLAAFAQRDKTRTAQASYEKTWVLADAYSMELEADPVAWADYIARPPGYRKQVAAWVMAAKQETTQRKRLATLVACCRDGVPIPPLRFSTSTRAGKENSKRKPRSH